MKSHQEWGALEGKEREWARGNEAADLLAKRAVSLHPSWTSYQRTEAERAWQQAVEVARLSARAIARWPKATRAPQRCHTSAAERCRQQELRTRQREQRHRAQKLCETDALKTHAWRTWQGGHQRCARCAAHQDQAAARRPCPGGLTKVEETALSARERGHQPWIATVLAPRGDFASLMVMCGHCGGYSQGGNARTRLGLPTCTPTDSGREALGMVRRGKHPRWPGYLVTSFQPVTVEESYE